MPPVHAEERDVRFGQSRMKIQQSWMQKWPRCSTATAKESDFEGFE